MSTVCYDILVVGTMTEITLNNPALVKKNFNTELLRPNIIRPSHLTTSKGKIKTWEGKEPTRRHSECMHQEKMWQERSGETNPGPLRRETKPDIWATQKARAVRGQQRWRSITCAVNQN